MTSTITLTGSKSKDWVITIEDKDGWVGDLQVTDVELKELKRLLDKKLK